MMPVIGTIIKTPLAKDDDCYLSKKEFCQKDWESTLDILGQKIRVDGILVVMPTETVYGLAANALNKDAVLRIFEAKRRPLEDPVICHVASVEEASELYNCSKNERIVIDIIAKQFWPGPLSIVARASDKIPKEVTAMTNYVAVRCPNHPIALNLIKTAKVPLAAPSANLFGHISPSTVSHVQKNFSKFYLNKSVQTELPILDAGPCCVGIESSVIKVDESQNNCIIITLLRQGAISLETLQDTLINYDKNIHKLNFNWFIKYSPAIERIFTPSNNRDTITLEKIESPGMLLKHYAPSIETYMLESITSKVVECSKAVIKYENNLFPLSDCILIDPLGHFSTLKELCLKYFNLININEKSPSDQDIVEVQQKLFAVLHEAEHIGLQLNSKAILIGNFNQAENILKLFLAAYDRFYRAASGRYAQLIFSS